MAQNDDVFANHALALAKLGYSPPSMAQCHQIIGIPDTLPGQSEMPAKDTCVNEESGKARALLEWIA